MYFSTNARDPATNSNLEFPNSEWLSVLFMSKDKISELFFVVKCLFFSAKSSNYFSVKGSNFMNFSHLAIFAFQNL